MMHLINIADMVDPDDPLGRTIREINLTRTHNIPLGSLVEIDNIGVRLFVVFQGRDCDGTPLYWLCHDPARTNNENCLESFSWTGGYSEESLTIIRSA